MKSPLETNGFTMLVILPVTFFVILFQCPSITTAQADPPISSPKLIIGAQIPLDNESLYRLPNQSQICNSFIHSHYLDRDEATSTDTNVIRPKPPSLPRPSGSPWSATGDWSELSARSTHKARAGSSYSMSGKSSGQEVYFENYSGSPRVTLYTFTTPSYPGNYPPQIDCIKIIRAPSADERIVLDFRGPVVLEPSSNCDNDYLEIRDGQYGFSPLVGRFCTDSWRLRPVISTGPWLWLRLQTDYTIEKTGFQAVYYFEPNRLEMSRASTNQYHKIETVVNLDSGTLLTKSNLTQLLRDYAQTLEGRPTLISGVREFIFDFRTVEEDMFLRIHLETIKFPVEESECHHNMIEMYGRFFLSDTPKSRSSGKTYSRLQLPPDSRVIRACKMASRSPILYRLGRSVVRIVATSSVQATRETDLRKDGPKHAHVPTPEHIDLPEIKLLATALTLAPCRPNWFPCMRVTDLLNIDRQLNVTGDSVLNVLMRPDFGTDQLHNARSRSNQSSSEHFDMNRRTARRRELIGDSVYCVAISQLCNQLNECPNGEDEDDCPRPQDNLLDILRYYKNIDTTHTSDISSTTTRSTVQSRKEREEAEDEFHHHPSIIIGLLGFCAICGLLSAGMTLVNRGKRDKRGNFSSVCNGVLFDSGTSLITTLEEGSVLHLDTRNGETSKFKVAPVKTVDSSGNSTVVHGRPEQTEKFRGKHDCCFGLICPVFKRRKKRKGGRPKSDPNNPSLPVGEIMNNPDGTESTDRKAKGSCSSADLRDYSASREVASHNCIEAFDRTIVPVTNVTCASSGRNELLLPQLSEEHSRTLLQRKVQSGELISRATVNMSRSTAASFGHLPNTIVCPVEKLSDAIYHCGIIPPGSTLNRTIWNRSGPLPLVNERDLTFPENYPYETLKTSKSAKCLNRRFSTDKHAISAFDFTNSEQRAYNESINEVTRTGTPSTGFPTPDFPVRNMQSSRMRNQLIDSRCTLYGRWGLDETQYNAEREDLTFVERRTTGLTGRRKSFKGGAPKRARYSFDPMNEPALSNPNTSETADHISRQADNDAQEVQAALQWTSSCSTSGELLDSGQSGREAAPRGWWKSPSKNNPSSRAPYWVGHTVGGKMVVGPSGTPSEDISLADLNESEITSNLIYRCDSSSLGSHLKTCRSANTSNMDEIRIPASIRASNKPEAHFKVTVVAKTRSSQSSDLRAGSGGVKPGIFGITAAQSEPRRDSGPSPGVSSVAPIQRYCDCALQSNDLVYRSHTRIPHLQGGGYGPIINSFTSSTPDKRAGECVPELDDSEDTATQNYSEETESGTNSDDRLANNSIERRENHVWRASDEHTVRNDGNVKTNQTVNEGNSKRATNTTTIIITSRDGARQIYREEQL